MSKKIKLPRRLDTILAISGAMLCGLGAGFANFASLGMDSVGTFYSGIRVALGFELNQMGTVSYIVSAILFIFLWFAARKYVSFGSFIFIVVYGICANLGTMSMEFLFRTDSVVIRTIIAIIGELLLFLGLGIYVAIDIGVDAFTGVILWICDITHKKLATIKIIFDLVLTVIGILLGGQLGVFTVITIIAGGPCVDFFTKKVQKVYFKHLLNSEDLKL